MNTHEIIAENERLRGYLRGIACVTQTNDLEWWQIAARQALNGDLSLPDKLRIQDLEQALRRIVAASPSKTNSSTAFEQWTWCAAVAESALEKDKDHD